MFTFGLIYVRFRTNLCLQFRLEWPGWPLFESDSNKRRGGGKTGPLFESPLRPLSKSGLQPLGRYNTCQETISRRPEQMYSSSVTGLEWLGEGPLFKSVSNKRRGSKLRLLFKSFPGPLLKSGMGLLARYCNHQEIINRRPEQMYNSSDTRCSCPGRGNYSSRTQINAVGPKRGHYSSHLLDHH